MSATQTTTQKATISATVHDSGVMVLTFSDGRTLSVDPTTLSDTIRNEAILHGLKQKLVDAAAIGRDIETGRSATLQDKYNAVKEVYDRITHAEGTWNKVRAGGTSVQTGGLLVRAMIQLSGKTREAVVAQIDALTKEQRTALRNNKRVAEVIASFKQNDVESEDILASMLDAE